MTFFPTIPKFLLLVPFMTLRGEPVASAVDQPPPLLGIIIDPDMPAILPGPEEEAELDPALGQAAHEFLIHIATRRREVDDQHTVTLRYSIGLLVFCLSVFGYLVFKGFFS